ncbi:MAG: hypothetical protein Q4P25_02960 [Tissierellia bacterium]|nr:hypothetical protein [Tissierellia bacterium]
MDERELRRRKRREKARRRKYRNRRIIALVILFVVILIIGKACGRKTPPDDGTQTPTVPVGENQTNAESQEEESDKNQNLTLGTRSIVVRNMNVSFGHFEHDGNMEVGEQEQYVIPEDVVHEIITTLETAISYEQDKGHQLKDLREDYMVIKLNPNTSLEVRNKEDFAPSYGQSLQGEEIPSGKYMYVNYYDNSSHGNGSVTSVFLSKENIVQQVQDIIDHHKLKAQVIELGQ